MANGRPGLCDALCDERTYAGVVLVEVKHADGPRQLPEPAFLLLQLLNVLPPTGVRRPIGDPARIVHAIALAGRLLGKQPDGPFRVPVSKHRDPRGAFRA